MLTVVNVVRMTSSTKKYSSLTPKEGDETLLRTLGNIATLMLPTAGTGTITG